MRINHRHAFVLLLGAFVVLALGYSMTVPLGEASDEVSHWSYIQYLVEHLDLPKPEGAVLGESHQPPLYYMIGALATFWVPSQDFQVIANPDFDLKNLQVPNLLLHTRREAFPYQGAALAWHLVRLLSVALGAVTVWATWRIALLVLSEAIAPPSKMAAQSVLFGLADREWIALAATAFVAFLPEFLFVSAVVNNDNLVVMLSSLGVLQTLRIVRSGFTWRNSLLLGLVLGLAPLSKLSGLVVWLFAAVGFALLLWKTRRWKEIVGHATLAWGLAAFILAPWMIYNLQRYGDPFGWSLLMTVTPVRESPLTLLELMRVFGGLLLSYWGRFGGALQVPAPGILYWILGGAEILGLLGWVRQGWETRKWQSALNIRAVLGWFLLFWFLLLAAHLRWTFSVLGTDQARQLFPGLPLLGLFLTVGIARLFAPRRALAVAVCGVVSLAGLGILFYLNSLYVVNSKSLNSLPGLGSNAPADLGQMIRVTDYRVEQAQFTPGKPIFVDIYWQALSDPAEDYWLLLQLEGKDGVVANKDGVPTAGRLTTDWWKKGDVFASRHTLIIPEDIAPGTYALRLGLHPFGRWDWLTVRGQAMTSLGNIVVMPLQ